MQAAQGQVAAQSGRHDKIGAPALLAIRHLLPQDRGQANLSHARPPQHPLPLHQGGCRNDEDIIALALAPSFEQKRNIEDGERLAPSPGKGKKALFFGSYHRVKDVLEAHERRRVGKYPPSEEGAIDPARFRPHIGKRIGDALDREAAGHQEPVHRLIRVEERNAKPAEHCRGSGLAHADRPGEAEYDQCGGANVATSAARSSGVTRTGAPNHASNPGRP